MSARPRADRTQLLVALGLIALGIALLAERSIQIENADLKDTLVFGGLAAVFLVALIATRAQGFLIAALAFAGLSGAKYAVMLGEDSGGAVLLGPGVGFLAAYAIGALAFRSAHWWPLVPGIVLTLLGGLLVFGGEPGAQLAGRIWPLVLVGIGALILAGVAAVRRPHLSHPRS